MAHIKKKKFFFWNQILVHCEEELSSSQNCPKGNVDSLRPSGWLKISVDIYLFIHSTDICWEFTMCQTASLVAQMVKDLPAMQETWGLIPGLGRSPEEGDGYLLQYSCLENPMDKEPGGLQCMGSQRVGQDWATHTFTFRHCSGFWVCTDKRNRQTSFIASPTLRECLERKS